MERGNDSSGEVKLTACWEVADGLVKEGGGDSIVKVGRENCLVAMSVKQVEMREVHVDLGNNSRIQPRFEFRTF